MRGRLRKSTLRYKYIYSHMKVSNYIYQINQCIADYYSMFSHTAHTNNLSPAKLVVQQIYVKKSIKNLINTNFSLYM